jgi:hypothetical protein
LQSSLVQRRFYYVTRKGLEFLEAYRRIQSLLVYLEKEVGRKETPTAHMDYVGASEWDRAPT